MPLSAAQLNQGASIAACAREFGVSRETVRKRFNDLGANPLRDPKTQNEAVIYSLRDVVRAFRNDVPSDGNDKTLTTTDLRNLAQVKVLELDAQRKADELMQSQGALLHRDDVETTLSQAINEIKRFFLTLPELMERDAQLLPWQTQVTISLCEKALSSVAETMQKI